MTGEEKIDYVGIAAPSRITTSTGRLGPGRTTSYRFSSEASAGTPLGGTLISSVTGLVSHSGRQAPEACAKTTGALAGIESMRA
jgi:hypothetical protein